MGTESERILCVDDQQEILDLLDRHLRSSYDCVFAHNGAEALQLIETNGPFAVILSDFAMPGMDGVTLLGEVTRRTPDTIRIMLTAYDDIEVAITALHQGRIFRFLRKPWDADELRQALHDALDQHLLIASERRLTRELERANAELDKRVGELDELNRLLEYWVEFSPAVLYSAAVVDGGVTLSYVSKNFARLTGHERTKLIVDAGFWYANIHPEDAARVKTAVNAAVRTRQQDTCSLKYRVTHSGGGHRTVVDSFRILRSASGDPLEIVGAWLDTAGT